MSMEVWMIFASTLLPESQPKWRHCIRNRSLLSRQPPTGLSATAISGSQINLTWKASSGATSYNVKRSATSGCPYNTIATPTGTNCSNTGLSESTTYYYVVSAVNGAGEIANSTEASAMTQTSAPAAPANLAATAGDANVSLDWADNGESDLDSYNVYRSTTSGSYGAALATGIGLSAYMDNSALNGTTYYYVVTAVDADAHESACSNEAMATPNDGSIISLGAADFESGFGDWVNISGQDSHDWTRNSGGTLTPSTGPDQRGRRQHVVCLS